MSARKRRRLLPSTTRGRVLAVLGVVVVVAFLALTTRLFVWPPTDQPTHSDAAVVLGGNPEQLRIAEAFRIARAGYTSIVVISLGNDPTVLCPRAPKHVQVICFRPNPVDTRGEAEYVARLAARRHWQRIIVVPVRSQTTRARLLIERCTDVNLEMVPVADPPSRVLGNVIYEWGALLKALILKRSC